MLLLRCIEDPQTHMYQVDWHETTLIHHVTKNMVCGTVLEGPWRTALRVLMSCIKHRRRIGNPKIVRIVPGGRDKEKLKRNVCLKVVPTMGKEKKSGQK